uniref:Uncharacterized protein n=1 Tax=Tetradesmus obliquus TaxID=3088 RepID=A0A383VY63_TETOB|eukprot:jgi/Sobl393_1/11976/SZX70151.1
MSGKLYMLTPISSPMVTRPTSPTAGEAAGATAASFEESAGMLSRSSLGTSRFAKLGRAVTSSTASGELPTNADCSPFAIAAMQPARTGSPEAAASSPAGNHSSSSAAQQQVRWRSPPCCSSCGAAKADGGCCSGCGGRLCKACVLPECSSSRMDGVPDAAAASAKAASPAAGRSGLGGSCSNCSSLCNACKPIICSFCELSSGTAAAGRMCEACAGTCDCCKRPACDPCAASFAACASCGYATCEACSLQMRMGREGVARGAAAAAGANGAGCWCAPPLRSASNVRHVSSQRYQLSQLHPSVLASSMQAAGLRDPEDYEDDENDNSYDDFEYDFEFNPATSSSVMNAAAAFDALARGGGGSSGPDKQQRQDMQQQLDADVLSAHHRHWAGAASGSDRLAGLDAKSLGAVLGAIGSLSGSLSGAYGLASPGSSHSSGSHMLQGSYQGSFAAAAAAAAASSGSSAAYYHQHQQQQQQQRAAGGTGAAAVVAAAAAAGLGAQREVRCV